MKATLDELLARADAAGLELWRRRVPPWRNEPRLGVTGNGRHAARADLLVELLERSEEILERLGPDHPCPGCGRGLFPVPAIVCMPCRRRGWGFGCALPPARRPRR